MNDLMRFPHAMRRDPRVEAWFSDFADPHRLMTREWFERMRGCGGDVRELLHDGCPFACVGDAAFGYVNAFRAHANIGFFHGATLADPAGLLEGAGKRMRHVKLRPGKALDEGALGDLVDAAYQDIRHRLGLPDGKSRRGRKDEGDDMTNSRPGPAEGADEESPSRLIDAKIAALGDWRGEMLARLRSLVRQADPDVVETVKWRKPSNPSGVPVWEHAGILCTGETYKDKVKLTFARGAALADPSGLFNSSLEGNARRAIDVHQGDTIDAEALKALVRAAVAANTAPRAAAGRNP